MYKPEWNKIPCITTFFLTSVCVLKSLGWTTFLILTLEYMIFINRARLLHWPVQPITLRPVVIDKPRAGPTQVMSVHSLALWISHTVKHLSRYQYIVSGIGMDGNIVLKYLKWLYWPYSAIFIICDRPIIFHDAVVLFEGKTIGPVPIHFRNQTGNTCTRQSF